MAAFRKSNSSRLRRYSPERTDATDKVMGTLDQLRLSRSEVVLVGSAALALYGALPPVKEGKKNPRPRDVDFASTLQYLYELAEDGTPTGLHGSRKTNVSGPPILVIPTRHLPADIIPFDRHATERADNGFRKRVERDSVSIDGTDIRVAAPHMLKKELMSRGRVDTKARDDLAALRRQFTDL